MDQQNNNFSSDSLIGVVRVIYRWRKYILFLTIAGVIVSGVVSFTMPDYYKSTAVFYPASEESVNRGGLYNSEPYLSEIGKVDMVERIITYGTSQDLIDHMIKKFDLYNHYQLDSTSRKGPTLVKKRFLSLYTLTKNEYGALEMTIEDKDPSFPKAMVQEAMNKIDELYQGALKSNRKKTLNAFEEMLASKRHRQQEVNDTLRLLRQNYNIINVESQSEVLGELVLKTEAQLAQESANLQSLKANPLVPRDTIAFVQGRVDGLTNRLKSLTTDKGANGSFNATRFNVGREAIVYFENIRAELIGEVNNIEGNLYQLRTSNLVQPSMIIPADLPREPKSKSRPVRSAIIAGASFLCLLVAILSALIFDKFRNINWKETLHEQ